MPRKPKEPHPSLRRNAEQPLQHGDVYEEHYDDFDDDDDEDEDELETNAKKPDPAEERFARLEREMESLRRENDDLRRRNPVRPVVQQAEPEDDEPDWDEMIFKDPKAAMKLHGERVAKKVAQDLRREYQQDQGTTQFWTDFYADHPDLREDDDLVNTVLNSNLDKLGGMPVKKAMDELADLTRRRIMRYSNNKGRKPGNRAVAEGASAPTPGRAAPVAEKVVTLTDIIRNRKAKRSKAASAA